MSHSFAGTTHILIYYDFDSNPSHMYLKDNKANLSQMLIHRQRGPNLYIISDQMSVSI